MRPLGLHITEVMRHTKGLIVAWDCTLPYCRLAMSSLPGPLSIPLQYHKWWGPLFQPFIFYLTGKNFLLSHKTGSLLPAPLHDLCGDNFLASIIEKTQVSEVMIWYFFSIFFPWKLLHFKGLFRGGPKLLNEFPVASSFTILAMIFFRSQFSQGVATGNSIKLNECINQKDILGKLWGKTAYGE